MKFITDRKILKIAQLYKEGKTVEEIIKKTGVKTTYLILCKLKKAGADLPKRAKMHRKTRDWALLVESINTNK